MNEIDAMVVTTISPPNQILKQLSENARLHNVFFYIIGDKKTPVDFQLENSIYLAYESQKDIPMAISKILPSGHYSRKNIGYLLAIKNKARLICETDDDNYDLPNFWNPRYQKSIMRSTDIKGWYNAYSAFGQNNVWPRGFPLEHIKSAIDTSFLTKEVDSPIQQALANDNPDVDAVFRMTRSLPVTFDRNQPVALDAGTWCPFNSQATFWFKDAFPLMYLPSYCSFRMTDIWRSFIAQRILWTCNWKLSFHEPLVRQERNDHSLLNDFRDEIPGYIRNDRIRNILEQLDLKSGVSNIYENLIRCYKALIKEKLIENDVELKLLDAWISDIISVSGGRWG